MKTIKYSLVLSLCSVGLLLLIALPGPAAPASAAVTRARPSHSVKQGGTIIIAPGSGGPWTDAFNPYSPAANSSIEFGTIYEYLYNYNSATHKYIPWLATGYRYSDGGKKITFTIRTGVRWSNGLPFTPQDVAFTWDYVYRDVFVQEGVKKNTFPPAVVHGQNVTFTFPTSQYTNFMGIGTEVPMLPPFTFQHVKDPLTFTDTHPIGTGPFVLKSENAEYITLDKNPYYWQKGLPHASQVIAVATDSGESLLSLLVAHKVDAGSVITPNLKSTFVDADPSRNILDNPPVNDMYLLLDFHYSQFRSLALREAINDAVNRQEMATVGESGLAVPANKAGLAGSNDEPYVLRQYKVPTAMDVRMAKEILARADYAIKGGSLISPITHQPVTFSVLLPSSSSDWVTDCQILSQDVSALHISVSCDGVSSEEYANDMLHSDFQGALATAGPASAYNVYVQLFNVSHGHLPSFGANNGNINFERYVNWSVVNDLNIAGSLDPQTQHPRLARLVGDIEAVEANDVPVIPLVTQGFGWEFVNGPFYGWPTEANQYMCTFCVAGLEQPLLYAHLR